MQSLLITNIFVLVTANANETIFFQEMWLKVDRKKYVIIVFSLGIPRQFKQALWGATKFREIYNSDLVSFVCLESDYYLQKRLIGNLWRIAESYKASLPKKYFLKKFIILRTFNDRLTNWLWREGLYLVNYLNGVTDDNQTNLRKTIRFVCHVLLWYFPCNTIAYFPRLFAWLRRQNDYYF